jgi:hypothetical protein
VSLYSSASTPHLHFIDCKVATNETHTRQPGPSQSLLVMVMVMVMVMAAVLVHAVAATTS